jgi:NAD(P)-dependent dehydrogenase (short-subunit alcohol dehydrogenase family)
MDLELKEAVVVVTGGTDGLGRALAARLLAEGARVSVCGRDERRLEETVAQLSGLGPLLALRADVTETDDLRRLVSRTVEEWGGIDGLVNNAGRSAAGSFEGQEDTVWEADLELKVMAAVRLTRLALPLLRQSASPSVVNVLSIMAKTPGAGSLPTSASRAAGLAITKALSKELGPDGVRVNAVLIGLVRSGQWRRLARARERDVDALYASMASEIPLGRVGREEEFADVAAFLLSRRASYVTGSAINLDGGQSPVL